MDGSGDSKAEDEGTGQSLWKSLWAIYTFILMAESYYRVLNEGQGAREAQVCIWGGSGVVVKNVDYNEVKGWPEVKQVPKQDQTQGFEPDPISSWFWRVPSLE